MTIEYTKQVLAEIFKTNKLHDRYKYPCRVCNQLGCMAYNIANAHPYRLGDYLVTEVADDFQEIGSTNVIAFKRKNHATIR